MERWGKKNKEGVNKEKGDLVYSGRERESVHV